MHSYEHLLRPLRLAGLTLKNRLLSAPTSLAEEPPQRGLCRLRGLAYTCKTTEA